MALKDVLYRCPFCGTGPTRGRKDHAYCPGCERHFIRGGAPALVDVRSADAWAPVPARSLLERIRELGPRPAPSGEDGEGVDAPSVRVRVRRSTREDPLRFRGRILGFVEQLGSSSEMTLVLGRTGLELHGDDGSRRCWNLMDLRALQASSSSLQVYTKAEELVHFRFLEDSAYRWERLIQEALRAAYREAGKGEIVEFQPRITVR